MCIFLKTVLVLFAKAMPDGTLNIVQEGLRKYLLEELDQTFPDEVEAYRDIRVTSAADFLPQLVEMGFHGTVPISMNLSRVFKVLKRIDGCLYAVKQSIKQLHNETERKRALMEVQALAALGFAYVMN
ncbi:wee1-like protein kinase isoform X2 [Carex littledalei]|uniref:Wee1-like protein kinase isoform X2 n=1 Tax=Carex littledalei TaxID=544730 RepID=A0A833VT93_9POAL|nr:wee1-like protein kinase isoform X2 [Carex littledalei]